MAVIDDKEVLFVEEDSMIEKEKKSLVDAERLKAQEELARKKFELQQQALLEKEKLLDERRQKDEQMRASREARLEERKRLKAEKKAREKAESEAKKIIDKEAKAKYKEEKAQEDYEKLVQKKDMRDKAKADIYRKNVELKERMKTESVVGELGIDSIKLKDLKLQKLKQERELKLIPSKQVASQMVKETGLGIKEGIGAFAEKFKKKVYLAPKKTQEALGRGVKLTGEAIAGKIKDEANYHKSMNLYRKRVRISAQKMNIKREELERAGLRRPRTIPKQNMMGSSIFKPRQQSSMPTMKIFEPRRSAESYEPRKQPKIFEQRERREGREPLQVFGSTRNGMSSSKIFNPNRQGGLNIFEFKRKKRNKK